MSEHSLPHDAPSTPPVGRPAWLGAAAMVAVLLGIGALTWTALGRVREREHMVQNALRQDGPRRVLVVRALAQNADAVLSLPGSVQTTERATVYARAQGYVRAMRVNIGDVVHAGQVLAVLETPELNAQLRVADARVREAQSSVPLARVQFNRAVGMADAGFVAVQDREAAEQRYITAQASVGATAAEVQRLRSLVHDQQVFAPFDGTVVRRLVDPGALVVAGTTPMLEIATTQSLKVVVDVPQLASSSIRVGQTLQVSDRSDTVRFPATVLRTSGALDLVSRTLRVEAALAHSPLLAGAYVMVRVPTSNAGQGVLVPNMVLGYGPEGPRVIVLNEGNVLHWQTVQILRDRGRDIEVAGVAPGAQVVLYPVPEFQEGEHVVATERPAAPPPAAPAARPAAH